MSSLDFDLDSEMTRLESEWRVGYEASKSARAEWRSLTERTPVDGVKARRALERLQRAEIANARIMAKIERLEATVLGED